MMKTIFIEEGSQIGTRSIGKRPHRERLTYRAAGGLLSLHRRGGHVAGLLATLAIVNTQGKRSASPLLLREAVLARVCSSARRFAGF